ncbi:MAG: ABC transporter ATP-binding protein [Anaerococcus sp.]|uniref:ABC transporter ATP-binding protein n=1 Tax=Anaerococcus nagyae TaxID=1755241 RepID=A0A3E2TK32_9FIRM|nr:MULTISPECIES: ABC transporter ATP-binding protein [Anaerococcus]MDU2353478.1 ABC transporter ATP-binding protein [Anaerococcus sp.]RGB77299.1 ABC transporter ATP-binding protein [Anaerococcus nagyae]
MKELKFILNQMWSKDPFMYVIVILNSIINGVLPFIWIFAPAYVIDNKDKGLEFFIPFFIGLFILTSLMKFLNSFLTGNYRMRMNNLRYGLNTNIINYSLSLSYSKQQDKKYKEIITDAIRSIQYPFDGFGGIILHMPLIFGLIISLIGYLWIFTALEWWLIIYMIVLTFFSCKFIYKTTFIYDAFWNDIDYTWEQLQQLNYELQSPISKLDILMYDYNTLFKKYYSSITKHWDNEFVKSNSKVFTLNLKAKVISLIRDVPVFYWLISNLQNGNIRLSKFYILFTSLFSFVIIVDNLADQSAYLVRDLNLFKYYFKTLDKPVNNYKKVNFSKIDIEFKNVYFKYPKSNTYTLKNINLKLNNNESIAIVGENGAGKSTLALILAGLYEPTSGKILLNGEDINSYNIDRKDLVSAVFQDTLVMPYSIRENVAMNTDKKDLSKIYKKTGLDFLVDKYDNEDEQILLRTLDDNGIDLSGGQKQRLFLARAINKSSSHILILDEPTAQLDAIAEKELYELYNSITEDKSSIFISHRLASTKFCDKVIYLKDGEITEEGTHDELMSKNGEYKELFDIQAKNYKEEANA